jgi:DNA topoisomerase VI subunit B
VSSLQQRETFRTSRLLAFASERELTAQIGHRREQWPRVAVKELVDNAIDACEERGIPPEIRVRVAHDRIEVGDNGPGIAEDVVADVLDFAVRVSSRKAYVGSTRGAQGNALKTLVAMPFARDGEHGLVEIESRGVLHRIAFAIDQIAQEPQAERSTKPSLVRNGTVVRIRWPDSATQS